MRVCSLCMDNVTDVFTYTEVSSASTTSTVSITIRSIILICITICSGCGNFIVFLTLYRRQYLLTPSNKLVLSLTFSNFLFTLLILPFIITSSIKQEWVLGNVWCSLTGFVMLTVLGASMLTLSAISFDRYYAIVHPLKYPSVISSYRITAIIIFCWIISACCSVPPLFGAWSRYQFYHARMSCMPQWGLNAGFALFWVILCLICPYSVMIISYGCIFQVARKKANKLHSTAPSRFSMTQVNSFIVEDNEEDAAASDREAAVCQSMKHTAASKAYIHNPATDEQPSSCSCALDSGIAASVLMDESVCDNADVSFALPHQVMPENEKISYTPGIVLQNSDAVFRESSNNNNAIRVPHAGLISEESSLKPQTTCAMVHGSTAAFPSGDMDYLPVPASQKRGRSSFSGRHDRPERLHNQRKSMSLQESDSPVMAPRKLQKHNSLTMLSGPYRRGSEITILSARSRNLTRSGNSSRSSLFSRLSFRAKPWTYSHIRYYNNQKKAVCTILCVMGILVITMGPFLITTLYEVAHTRQATVTNYAPPVVDWVVSAATVLMLLTCVYYPLIYGLWNRTVRKEIRSLMCGRAKTPVTRRTRVLSLTTHLKDLGLSPRLTAAIMQETAAVATIVRPMKLEEKQSKKQPSQGSVRGKMKQSRKKSSFSDSQTEKLKENRKNPLVKKNNCKNETSLAKAQPPLPSRGEYKMRLKTKEEEEMFSKLNANNSSNKYRAREKPLNSLLQLDSSEVMSSDVLLPALLFSSPGTRHGVEFRRRRQEVVTSHDEPCCSGISSNRCDVVSGSDRNKNSQKLKQQRDYKISSRDVSVDSDEDSVSYDSSSGKESATKKINVTLQSSNLIHLEAGEPIKIRRWNKPQMVDYFAQTLAYSLLEEAKDPT